MSIVASVKVYDGVVLAADSVTSITGTGAQAAQFIKSYRHARKLFQLGRLPIGVVIYGVGNFGRRSVENYITEFVATRVPTFTTDAQQAVNAVAIDLHTFLQTAYTAAFGQLAPNDQPVFGLLLAGYTPNNPLPEEWEFILPADPQPRLTRPLNEFGSGWRGITLPFMRLYRGFDPRIQQRLVALGVAQAVVDQVKNEFPNLPIPFDGMPLQDACDFAHFILSTTIYCSRFEVGVAACGHPIDLAVITRAGGFEWIAEKKLKVPSE